MMNSHYHPPRCKSALYISDEWIEYIVYGIVERAEEKVLRQVQQDSDSKTLIAS